MRCVLRVFNGLLQGSEFPLVPGRTFFVVGSESTFCSLEQPPSVPEDAIYIPTEAGGCNFEIVLDEQGQGGCLLREYSDSFCEVRPLPFQELHTIGALQIAIRPYDDEWCAELLGAPIEAFPAPRPGWMSGNWKQRLGLGIGLALFLGLVGAVWYALQPTPVADVKALIAGNTNMNVIYGRDQKVYVFANSEREAGWGRQVMMRNGHPATQVLTIYDELVRLQNVLAQVAPQLAYHQLDLSDPARPRLLISQQRNLMTPDLQRHLEERLSEAAPYAHSILILSRDDNELARLAEEGLLRLALPFTRQQQPDSVTFAVKGSLADVELEKLSRYVAGFNQVWGERYIHFSVELKEDLLKGKSFQYGPQGYVKMNSSSWFFSQPL